MQKIINAMAVLSFIGTASIIGGGAYVYTQKDAIVDNVRERITEELAKALPDMIVGAVGGMGTVSYTHLRAHETLMNLVCRLLLEKKK